MRHIHPLAVLILHFIDLSFRKVTSLIILMANAKHHGA